MLDQHYLMVVNHRQGDELEQRLITAEMYFMWKAASTTLRPKKKKMKKLWEQYKFYK
jgi:hypothetical protein